MSLVFIMVVFPRDPVAGLDATTARDAAKETTLGGLVISGVPGGTGLGTGVFWCEIQIPSISMPLSRARDPKGISSSFSPVPEPLGDSATGFGFAIIFFIFNVLRIWTPDPYTRTTTWSEYH